MLISNKELEDFLVDGKLLTKAQIKKAEVIAEEKGVYLYEALITSDIIADSQLTRLVADFIGIPYVNLSQISIPIEVLTIVPEVVARKQMIIVFRKDKDGLHVAMANPKDEQIRDFLKKKEGVEVNVYLASERDIEDSIGGYMSDMKHFFDKIISDNVEEAKRTGANEDDLPIIKIVDTIIAYGYQNKASDIHVEPMKQNSIIRFRIDGVLHDIINMPIEMHSSIVIRIKVLAGLRTDEHQASQDGKLQYQEDKEVLDIRVSIIPVTGGEQIVMRLLSERSRRFSFSDMGFSSENMKRLEESYKKPYGMILATGPTGSGKTTTMYSILKILNKRGVNIMTIEDPVEYDIEGVNQIQVNPKSNLTFGKGLRGILRQDPDIILVGEIRDDETAGISVNAAMTGHLVLSTLHTNDAPTAVPRLLDMKIEPYIVASTVNVIIAQRLIRRICAKCKVSKEISIKAISEGSGLVHVDFGGKDILRVYEGKGCDVCHDTGYEGRIGIYEVLMVDDDIRQAINERKDADTIKKIAIKNGMKTMIQDGIEKVQQGITTIDELLRVTKE